MKMRWNWMGWLLVVLLLPGGRLPADQQSSPALMRIDVASETGYRRLQAASLQVYGIASLPDGSQRLYTVLAPDEAARLALEGFELGLLDANPTGAVYYRISALRPGALAGLPGSLHVLDLLKQEALVRAAPEEVERLASAGLALQRLLPHELPPLRTFQPAWSETITPDPQVQQMLAQVSSAGLSALESDLTGEQAAQIGGSPYTIATRYSRTVTPIEKATQYAYERLQATGLPASYHTYSLPGSGDRRNVIAEQAGAGQPERIFVLTAHLDSTSGDPYNLAPGADDNASGSAGVLLIAQIMSQYSFDCTLRYALFTGEEQGLYGSEAYAASAAALGENIEGVLNLDMIAYNSSANPTPDLDLYTRPGITPDTAIANLFVDVVQAYGLNLVPQIITSGLSASDHASFWDYGYPAILAIEDNSDFTPFYHTTNDRLSTLDLGYYTEFVKAAMAAFAHMGCLRVPQGALAGQVTDASTGRPLVGAQVLAEDGGTPWSTSTDAAGAYSLGLPVGTYQVSAQAPGYVPFFSSGVGITLGVTTTLDIPLAVCTASAGPSFVYAPSLPFAGQPVVFTGTLITTGTLPVSYQWDFGDGGAAGGRVVSHTFATAGAYPVDFTAVNCGGPTSASQSLAVSGVPALQTDPQQYDLLLGPGETRKEDFTIQNTGTADLIWSLVEQPPVDWLTAGALAGVVRPFSSRTFSLSFTAPSLPGVYTSTLHLSSNDPEQPAAGVPVRLETVCSALQGVAFSFNPPQPAAAQVTTFTALLSSGSAPVVYAWDFGDGGAASGASAVHTFNTAGLFTVTLTASNCAGPAAASQSVRVLPQVFNLFMPMVVYASP